MRARVCSHSRRAPAKPMMPVSPLIPHLPGDLSRPHPPLIPAASRSRAASLTPTNQPTHRMTTHSTPLRATCAEHWAALLAFRRQSPAVIVAAATGVSVLPALAHLRTSKLTALRLVARNSLLGGGGAAVLLYPEIVFRAAPYVSRGVTKAEDTIASVRAN
mmetsp:Transcript_3627/g.11529  ORF Transcript_3627/g.11529 Transcript_3627/m.11529 type:complete len:161 (-) Transcript_3627:156-638(-)